MAGIIDNINMEDSEDDDEGSVEDDEYEEEGALFEVWWAKQLAADVDDGAPGITMDSP